tara:strand:- start:79 stop:270 length:192 start_codon:yes stop_codon:yes gene_type:complete
MKELRRKKENKPGYNLIILMITILFLFLESILTLLKISKKGILKREVLSKKSNIGFDVKIIMK